MPSTRAIGSVFEVADLRVRFPTPDGLLEAVRGVSFRVAPGECLGIVGESGAGKSQSLLAVMGLLSPRAEVDGSARFGAIDLLAGSSSERNRWRGRDIAMIFQDPMSSLTPHLTVGAQLVESLRNHERLSRREARRRALALLHQVQLTDAERRLDQYPHELSGGMRQRVMIALALACNPKLLIADEPTTALDVTIQAQILSVLARLKRDRGMSMILITHDLGVIAGIADRVLVMQGGRVVEEGDVTRIFEQPTHVHTRELLAAMPRIDTPVPQSSPRESSTSAPQELLSLRQVRVGFPVGGGLWRRDRVLRALDGIDLDLRAGEALGIVGESGCGKSTLVRAILQLVRPSSGSVVWLGRSIEALSQRALRPLRRDLQIVFQDPLASLDPRMTVGEIVAEPLHVHAPTLCAAQRRTAVIDILARVGLTKEALGRYPHEFSGGQCQRIGIARAMILRPKLLVCDEPLSALDVSIQAQIVELLLELKRESGMSLIFVSHNLAVVRRLCERVLVLYLGKPMELAPTEELFVAPRHPYTQGLLEAVPIPDPRAQPRLGHALAGELPSPLSPPSGCVFRTRCPQAIDDCARIEPPWQGLSARHQLACIRVASGA